MAPSLLERARELASGLSNASFLVGDARALPVEDNSFDAVVFDSTFSHVSGTERVVAEAVRALRPGGMLAVFDCDYATATVALGDDDPLQACVNAMSFEQVRTRSHGYVDTDGSPHMLFVVDRGADVLAASGEISAESAEALKAEARRRAATGSFFGHIAYVALTAVRPSATDTAAAPTTQPRPDPIVPER